MARAVRVSMPDDSLPPTPYAQVNAVLHSLLKEVQAILVDRFVGLYLYGSLSSGDFNPRRSDIDFVVVTDGFLDDETIASLGKMHAKMAGSGDKWASKLEGAYLPQQLLGEADPQGAKVPQINEAEFYQAALGSDWVIQYHTLREQAVVVAGPSLHQMLEPTSPQALRQAVVNVLKEWWAPMLADNQRLQCSDYQAYAVLTMCRALYTLRVGGVPTKTSAARWARQTLDQKWHSLIEWAVEYPVDQAVRLDEVMELLRYTLEAAL